MNRPIALLTDFGLSDAYVGTMKGVIVSLCPAAPLIDITHDIAPQNVRQAAYVLLTAYRFFPPDTVFLVVVDPGVGTSRDPIAVETDHGLYIAPDNGVLSYVLAEVEIHRSVILQNPVYRLSGVSQTFHGRDIFSPAAAHLARGVPIEALGPEQSEQVRLAEPRLTIERRENTIHIHGDVLHIDHFGNIITSIGSMTWRDEHILEFAPRFGQRTQPPLSFRAKQGCVTIRGQVLCPIHATYGRVESGALMPLIGSSGQLEIGMNQGHAARALQAQPSDVVTLTFTLNQD